jgi:hypothetical protein
MTLSEFYLLYWQKAHPFEMGFLFSPLLVSLVENDSQQLAAIVVKTLVKNRLIGTILQNKVKNSGIRVLFKVKWD